MLTKEDLIKFGRSLDEDDYFFGYDYLELKAEEYINSQNSGKPLVSGSLLPSGYVPLLNQLREKIERDETFTDNDCKTISLALNEVIAVIVRGKRQ